VLLLLLGHSTPPQCQQMSLPLRSFYPPARIGMLYFRAVLQAAQTSSTQPLGSQLWNPSSLAFPTDIWGI
jgi:hypothetical protein